MITTFFSGKNSQIKSTMDIGLREQKVKFHFILVCIIFLKTNAQICLTIYKLKIAIFTKVLWL